MTHSTVNPTRLNCRKICPIGLTCANPNQILGYPWNSLAWWWHRRRHLRPVINPTLRVEACQPSRKPRERPQSETNGRLRSRSPRPSSCHCTPVCMAKMSFFGGKTGATARQKSKAKPSVRGN